MTSTQRPRIIMATTSTKPVVFNSALWPPSGWVFLDSDGVKHQGANKRDLLTKLKTYRSRNRLLPGNPEKEVNDQLCAQFPGYCVPPFDPKKIQRLVAARPRPQPTKCTTCKKSK